MSEYFTFDDVLILPQFSTLQSRKDVDLSSDLVDFPIISSNMKTVTESKMCEAMASMGGAGALHRFWTIEENVKDFNKCKDTDPYVSIGLGDKEKERADALISSGATYIIIDVANGANIEVAKMARWLIDTYHTKVHITAGNFANSHTIKTFKDIANIDCYKVGIGNGANCTTRLKTGVGYPQLSAIMECSRVAPIIADGGCKTPGDVAKALAAGAKAVMLGGMLAGTMEAAGDVVYVNNKPFKQHNGSAATGYAEGFKTSEGVNSLIEYKGSVIPILKDLEGGLRSSFSYVDARNLTQFQERAKFIKVSNNTVIENGPHVKGKIV